MSKMKDEDLEQYEYSLAQEEDRVAFSPPPDSEVVERDAQNRPTVYQDKSGEKYFTPDSTPYKQGHRTESERIATARGDSALGVHPGELVPEGTLILMEGKKKSQRITPADIVRKNIDPQILNDYIQRGAVRYPVKTERGGEILLTQEQAEKVRKADSDKERFNILKRYGAISGTAEFVTKEQAEKSQKSAAAARFTDMQFKKTTTELPGGGRVSNAELGRIKKESPDVYKILTTRGLEAANRYVDEQNRLYNEQQVALGKLERYTSKNKGGRDVVDVYAFLHDNPHINLLGKGQQGMTGAQATLIAAGFSKAEVKEWQAQVNKANSGILEKFMKTPEFTVSDQATSSYMFKRPLTKDEQAQLNKEIKDGFKSWGIASADFVIPGFYTARNWSVLSTKEKVINIGIDVAAVALIIWGGKALAALGRRMEGVTELTKLAKQAGKAGDELRVATKELKNSKLFAKGKPGMMKLPTEAQAPEGFPQYALGKQSPAMKAELAQRASLKADRLFLEKLQQLDSIPKKQLDKLEKLSKMKGLSKTVRDVTGTASKLDDAWDKMGKLKYTTDLPPATSKVKIVDYNLPKVDRGFVRLYRAEEVINTGTKSPLGQEKFRGQWFTTDRGVAERYLALGKTKVLKYIDVPRGKLGQYVVDISKLKGDAKWLKGTHLIPKAEQIAFDAKTARLVAVNKEYLDQLQNVQRLQARLQASLERADSVLKPRYTPSPPADEFKGLRTTWKKNAKVVLSDDDYLQSLNDWLATKDKPLPSKGGVKTATTTQAAQKVETVESYSLKLEPIYEKLATAKPSPIKPPKVEPDIITKVLSPTTKRAPSTDKQLTPRELAGIARGKKYERINEDIPGYRAKSIEESLVNYKADFTMKEWQSVKSAIKAGIRTYTKANTKANTITATDVEIRNQVKKVVQNELSPAVKPKVTEQIVTRITTATLTPVKPFPVKPLVPPPPPPVPLPGSDKEDRKRIQEAGGAIAWRMGKIGKLDRWDVIINPYSADENYMMVLGDPPANATIVQKGKGSAYGTAQVLKGKGPAKKVQIDSGIQDIHVQPVGKKKIRLRFVPDPEQETKGDITIGGRDTRISRESLNITRGRPAISRRGVRIMPKAPRISR